LTYLSLQLILLKYICFINVIYVSLSSSTIMGANTFRQGGLFMLAVTDSAIKNLKSYLEQNNIDSAIRVAIMQGG